MHAIQQSTSAPSHVNEHENGPVVLRIHRGGFTSMNQAIEQAKRQKPHKQSASKAAGTSRTGATTLSTIDAEEDGVPDTAASSAGSSPPAGQSEAAARAQRNLKAWSMGKRFAKLAKEKKAAKTLGNVLYHSGVMLLHALSHVLPRESKFNDVCQAIGTKLQQPILCDRDPLLSSV